MLTGSTGSLGAPFYLIILTNHLTVFTHSLTLTAFTATVPSREWLEFEGDVISSLFAQTESALTRRWRSRHENGYHKSDG
jgi:hypothetical protein